MATLRRARLGFPMAVALVAMHAACGSETLIDPPVPTDAPDAEPSIPAGEETGAPEAGATDAGSTDGPVAVDASDATPPDAGATDAGPPDTGPPDAGPPPLPNILFVISDEIGLDSSVCHTITADPGHAPRIADLCTKGVTFDNAWAAPSCSPTRATILTGRHGFRTNVGFAGHALPPGERGLPASILDGNPAYAVAAAGKWHLSNAANGGPNHPNLLGFTHYAGNLQGAVAVSSTGRARWTASPRTRPSTRPRRRPTTRATGSPRRSARGSCGSRTSRDTRRTTRRRPRCTRTRG